MLLNRVDTSIAPDIELSAMMSDFIEYSYLI